MLAIVDDQTMNIIKLIELMNSHLFCSILLISSNQDVDDYISLSGKQNQFYTEDIFDFLRENYDDDDDDN